MGKNKLKHFEENETFPNMFQPSYEDLIRGFSMKGNWKSNFFNNSNPIVVELGCGKGEYTVGLAKRYPDKNFIGIDVKGARMWRGCKTSLEEDLKNVAFIRSKIQLIELLFTSNEIHEIWITFPDPQPRHARMNQRLTSPRFLSKYAAILTKDAVINLKTDNEPFFDYTLEVIKEENHNLIEVVKNLYDADGFDEVKAIRTYYEKKFNDLGFSIHYLKFKLNDVIQ